MTQEEIKEEIRLLFKQLEIETNPNKIIYIEYCILNYQERLNRLVKENRENEEGMVF